MILKVFGQDVIIPPIFAFQETDYLWVLKRLIIGPAVLIVVIVLHNVVRLLLVSLLLLKWLLVLRLTLFNVPSKVY